MSYRLVVIKDLPHLFQSIADFGSSAGEIWYRGETVHHNFLEPSAYRSSLYTQSSKHIELKSIAVSRAKMFNLPGSDKLSLDLDWLSNMQHYGVPTRLLDWSRDHNVAMFFAFEDYLLKKIHGNGLPCIWVFKPTEFNKILITIIKMGKWPIGLTRKQRTKLVDKFYTDCRPTYATLVHDFQQENPGLLDDIYISFVCTNINKRSEAQESRFVRFPLLNNKQPAIFKQHQLNEFILTYPQLADCFAKFIFLNPVAMSPSVIGQNPKRSRMYPEAQNYAEDIKNELFY